MILAQIQEITHSQLGLASAILFAFVMLCCNVALAIAAFRKPEKPAETPQPLIVKSSADCVTEKVCKEHRAALEKAIEEVKHEKKEADVSAKKDRKDLYDHIDKVRQDLTDKVDELPNQIIALLKNTGAIK